MTLVSSSHEHTKSFQALAQVGDLLIREVWSKIFSLHLRVDNKLLLDMQTGVEPFPPWRHR
jgi:glutamate 5-kinase